ncbi:hypothetical protein M0805_007420 [Coniferiporia weirii]|nr:hypothetical protein M0805_007420 [Coniferiporia weirii]
MTARRPPASVPSSPPLSPSLSNSSFSYFTPVRPLKSQIPGLPRRLLVPAYSTTCLALNSADQPVRSKQGNGRPTRPRANSAPPESVQPPKNAPFSDFDCRFQVAEQNIRLSGYQLFAVEKWIVERTRATTLLSVYTGDPKDQIFVTALALPSSLPNAEAQLVWEKAIHALRKDGARPRETDKGIIMVTSLANFRSDYTVVYIPEGDINAHREQLYVNINLMRMGCSGRSALTLQEPSDTTKDRFITTYRFEDAIRSPDCFKRTVLELVKFIQCALSLFEMFPIDIEEQTGLLCDITVNGIQKWVAETGKPYMGVESTDRMADPSTVSALLSLVLSMRNKLSVIGLQAVPKDPFLHPRRFTRSLAQFVNQRINQNQATTPSGPTICHHAYLNLTLIKHIDLAYDKYRSSDAYKLHRVVLNKLDDFTSATTSAMTSSKGGIRHGRSLSLSLSSKERDAESLLDGTSDLATFVTKMGLLRGKDCPSSVRCLWTGRFDTLERKRQDCIWSDAEEEKDRERERSDSDEDGDLLGVLPWSNKVQKKLENWAGREFGRNKPRKTSADMSNVSINERSPESLQNTSGQVPYVVVSRDPDEPLSGLSSGQVSPISPAASMYALGNFSSQYASALAINEGGYHQRLAQLNQRWPTSLTPRRRQVVSWSDPVSAEALIQELDTDMDLRTARTAGSPMSGLGLSSFASSREGSSVASRASSPGEGKRRIPFFLRKKSFDDRTYVDQEDVLSVDRMQVDVELCAQCLIMHQRKFLVEAILAALQALVQTTSTSNADLLRYNGEHGDLIRELTAECDIAADIEEAVSTADSAHADTDALLYEANFLDVHSLWRMAQGPRLRIFAIRDRVFGTRGRRREPDDATDDDGRFNRVQRRLDGSERLVDYLGRTESDAEEEDGLPEDEHPEGEGDSENEEEGKWENGENTEESQLQALSNWLLTLFTKWGRVLGVGRTAVPSAADPAGETPAKPQEELEHVRNGGTDTKPLITSRQVVSNGHHNRLSTVGEEDEDAFHESPSNTTIG